VGSIARRCWTAIVAVIALTLASGWNVAAGQNLVGTWKLISETVQHGDQTDQPFGESPLGMMMLDSGGRFMLLISRPDLPRIEANRRDAGTPEENKTILTGTLAFFGSYRVSMPDGTSHNSCRGGDVSQLDRDRPEALLHFGGRRHDVDQSRAGRERRDSQARLEAPKGGMRRSSPLECVEAKC
jgi:hypothetical protein